jgi:hypothetical protein
MDMDRVTRLTAIRLLFGQAPQGQKLYSSAGNNAINWRDGHETTDEENAQIDAEFERLKQLDSYQHPRRVAYPSWQDQMDMQYHDAVDGTTTWQETIQAVKDKHPKP